MNIFKYRIQFTCVLFLFTFLITPFCLAKTINLYEQPKGDAKIIGTIDSQNGMTPIFTPKEGDWIKVGDPKNGNVGWVKVNDLSNDAGSVATELTITQHTIKTSQGPKTYQVIQFGVPQPMTAAQTEAAIKQMEQHQQDIQKSMQKMMQSIFENMNNFYKDNSALFDKTNFPVFMPVIVIPDKTPTATKSTPAPVSATPKKP